MVARAGTGTGIVFEAGTAIGTAIGTGIGTGAGADGFVRLVTGSESFGRAVVGRPAA